MANAAKHRLNAWRYNSLMLFRVPILAAALLAAVPALAGDDRAALTPGDELNVRNCVRLDQTPTAALKPEMIVSNNDHTFNRANCIHLMAMRSVNAQRRIELPNRSTDTHLANCVRAFFGTEFDVERDRVNCGMSPVCTATLTVVATDGTQTKQLDVSSGLIELNIHPTGRWLSLNAGEFSCQPREKTGANPR
jgi:hypothetical protein